MYGKVRTKMNVKMTLFRVTRGRKLWRSMIAYIQKVQSTEKKLVSESGFNLGKINWNRLKTFPFQVVLMIKIPSKNFSQ